ncbi:MAG: NADPH-dependent F420 reductase [Vulcanimicrobiaceae bacterium]
MAIRMTRASRTRTLIETGLAEPTIGILGAGRMGMALASRWVASGHRVFLGSRSLPRALELSATLGPNALGASYRQAAASGHVIVLTIPPHAVLEVVGDLAELFDDKIVLDCSASASAVTWEDRHLQASLAEQVAHCAPGARVIKALATMPSSTIAGGHRPKPRTLYCGDDVFAKSTVRRLLEELELDPVDGGALSEARHFEYFASRSVWNVS